jgi:hypothetical protein
MHPARQALLGFTVFVLLLAGFAVDRYLTHRPTVNVRWSADLPDGERTELERQFRLKSPQPHGEDRKTWIYDLHDVGQENLHAIVGHSSVLDTHGIERTRFELVDPPDSAVVHVVQSLPVALALSLLCGALIIRRSASARVRQPALSPEFEWGVPWYGLAGAYIYAPLAALACALQVVSYPTLMNDHAGYLAMAQQIVLGEWPIRDFLDHGTFLHILVSGTNPPPWTDMDLGLKRSDVAVSSRS